MLIGGILILIFGCVMFFMPQQYIKPEERNNPETVAKMKKRGIAVIICAIIIILCSFVLD